MDTVVIRPGFFPSLVEYCVANPFIVLLLSALLVMGGVVCLRQLKLDALPDISDNQVIVMADWMGSSPELVDNQVAYPLSTQFTALPHLRDIRTMSSFGLCMIYLIFDDDVDIYWARTRVAERLAAARRLLPADAMAELGPEGTGVARASNRSSSCTGPSSGSSRTSARRGSSPRGSSAAIRGPPPTCTTSRMRT